MTNVENFLAYIEEKNKSNDGRGLSSSEWEQCLRGREVMALCAIADALKELAGTERARERREQKEADNNDDQI